MKRSRDSSNSAHTGPPGYILDAVISSGTYGIVWKGRSEIDGTVVALKQIKLHVPSAVAGFPITALRELNILMQLAKEQHPNIMRVYDMVSSSDKTGIYMVMEYLPMDLRMGLTALTTPLPTADLKCYMLQLIAGVAAIHDHWVLHRDIKPANILVSSDGRLALADFGMARRYGAPLREYTADCVSLWYRAPEMLLGCKTYGPAADMWAVGCIMLEALNLKIAFKGKSEVGQLDLIFGMLGVPTQESWPGWTRFPRAAGRGRWHPVSSDPAALRRRLNLPAHAHLDGALSDTGLDLLLRLLAVNPTHRVTAAEARAHPWFREAPLPISPALARPWPKPEPGTKAAAGQYERDDWH